MLSLSLSLSLSLFLSSIHKFLRHAERLVATKEIGLYAVFNYVYLCDS